MTTPREVVYRTVAAEAEGLLSRAVSWRLPPERWPLVDEAVGAVAAAMAARDPAGLRAATARLEDAGPGRVVRLGEEPPRPPPAPLRDRIVRVVRTGAGDPAPPPDPEADERATGAE